MAVKEHAGKTKFAGVYKIALVDGPGCCGGSAAAAGLMLSIVLVSILYNSGRRLKRLRRNLYFRKEERAHRPHAYTSIKTAAVRYFTIYMTDTKPMACEPADLVIFQALPSVCRFSNRQGTADT